MIREMIHAVAVTEKTGESGRNLNNPYAGNSNSG